MKIVMVGDPHGDTAFISKAFDAADKQGAKILVLLGDNDGMTPAFYKQLVWDSNYWGIPVIAVNGNHDMITMLYDLVTYEEIERKFGTLYGAGIIGENVYFMPTGSTASIGGKSFLFVGGASSIDKGWRIERDHELKVFNGDDVFEQGDYYPAWYAQEMISEDQKEMAMSVGKVDVLISHDVTDLVPLEVSIDPSTERNRGRLTEIVKACRPEINFHGHWHRLYSHFVEFPFDRKGNMDWHRMKVVGLDCNQNSKEALVMYDTDEAL